VSLFECGVTPEPFLCTNRRVNGPVRVNPHGFSGWFELIFTKLFWATWRLALPLLHPAFHISQARFWGLFMISEFVTGYFLAFNFQVSHVSSECDYPLGDKPQDQIADEWAVSQVRSRLEGRDDDDDDDVRGGLAGAWAEGEGLLG
jgi:hypothetical protein